jgi:hypothetical protein
MATAPADQQRPVFIAAALFAVALMVFATRALKTGGEIAALPLPAADLDAISSFLSPLSPLPQAPTDRTSADAGNVVIARDPFVATGVASSQAPFPGARVGTPPKPTSRQPWIVSTILLEGTRKSAIVNDVWVTVGDSLAGGSRLTAVERDHIVVTDAKGIRHNVPIQGGESW